MSEKTMLMSKSNSKMVEVGGEIDIWGWVMLIEPFYTANGEKYGDRLKVKTVARTNNEGEIISVYLDLVVRTGETTEKLRPFNRPIPVRVKGIKRWQKPYPNLYKNDLENTNTIMWIGLYNKGLSVVVIEKIPDTVMVARKIEEPSMTMTEYFSKKSKEKMKASREHKEGT